MGRVPITVMGYHCERCEHEWIPRSEADAEPKVCPKCKSPYWNRPRQDTTKYEQFRDAILNILRKSPEGLTWTEVRTAAAFPQKFPNNVWVHRMETEIGLLRVRDAHGILRWKLS